MVIELVHLYSTMNTSHNLAVTHPDVAAQWHPTLNGGLKTAHVTAGSNRKVWWLGECGHSWEAKVAQRCMKTSGCPYCSNRATLIGFNDLTTTHPEAAARWHPTRNNISPETVSQGSSKKVWVTCPNNHDQLIAVRNIKIHCATCQKHPVPEQLRQFWADDTPFDEAYAGSNIKRRWRCDSGHVRETSVANMLKTNMRCPECNVKEPLHKTHSRLARMWDIDKNSEKLQDATYKASSKRWWKCENLDHSWFATMSQASKSSCFVCSNKTVLPGFNDLASTHPEIASQWDVKNEKQATEVTAGSGRRVWWVCSEQHSWQASVLNRTSGTGCPFCSNRKVMPGFNDLVSTHPEIAAQWEASNRSSPTEVSQGSPHAPFWVCGRNHVWKTQVYNRTRGTNCPHCQTNKAETEIVEYLNSFKLTTLLHNRTTLPNKQEIDILLPEKKIGIEFNGLYWHNETAGKHRTYHHDKWAAAKQVGVQLIQIWEDDWNRNPDLIKRMLAHKLGVSQERTVYARRTIVVDLATSEAKQFLNSYHIQGYASASYYLGLRDIEKGETVAVLALKKEAGTEGRVLNIVRYATSANVVGGFTKLLTYAERTYRPELFITFADHCVSDGGLYENNGFLADKELPPDYMYVMKSERKHKFGYRLKKFRDDPTLKYEEGLTERELASLNSIPRIWDAGKTKYVKQVQTDIFTTIKT